MIIDTMGFNIGDEVWWREVDYSDSDKLIYRSGIVHEIIFTNYGIFFSIDNKCNNRSRIHIDVCFSSEQEIDKAYRFIMNKIANIEMNRNIR